MLWTLALILAVLWGIGMVMSFTVHGAIHVLIVLAVLMLCVHLYTVLKKSKGCKKAKAK